MTKKQKPKSKRVRRPSGSPMTFAHVQKEARKALKIIERVKRRGAT